MVEFRTIHIFVSLKQKFLKLMKPKLGQYLYLFGLNSNSSALCFAGILLIVITGNRKFFFEIEPFFNKNWFTKLIWQRNDPQFPPRLAIERLEQVRND